MYIVYVYLVRDIHILYGPWGKFFFSILSLKGGIADFEVLASCWSDHGGPLIPPLKKFFCQLQKFVFHPKVTRVSGFKG